MNEVMSSSQNTSPRPRKQKDHVVLALGVFRPSVHGKSLVRGMEGVVNAARTSCPGNDVKFLSIRDLTDHQLDFRVLSEEFTEEQRQGHFQGYALPTELLFSRIWSTLMGYAVPG